jgi:hypothetical protein
MRQGSQRLKEHFPKETILKLENFTFTMAAIYFSNTASKWLVPLIIGLIESSKERARGTTSLGV